MRGFRLILVVLACAGAVFAWSPAGALASSGCNGSAGDSQYVDPLANCNPPATSGGGSGGGSSSQTGSGSVTTPSQTATIASSSPTTTATPSASSKDPSSSKTLPFTGLDLVPALIVAVALLGSGIALRRLSGDVG